MLNKFFTSIKELRSTEEELISSIKKEIAYLLIEHFKLNSYDKLSVLDSKIPLLEPVNIWDMPQQFIESVSIDDNKEFCLFIDGYEVAIDSYYLSANTYYNIYLSVLNKIQDEVLTQE